MCKQTPFLVFVSNTENKTFRVEKSVTWNVAAFAGYGSVVFKETISGYSVLQQ